MAFLDGIGKKISDAGQSTVKKTQDFANVSKLNSQIADEEKNQNRLYYQIGKLYFSKHQNDCEDEFVSLVRNVIDSEARIKDYRHEISVIKGIVICPKCGAENAVGAMFCTSCGADIPKEESLVDDSVEKCPNCGEFVPKGTRFCTSCGKPMDMGLGSINNAEAVDNTQ